MSGITVQQTIYLQAYVSASVNVQMDWRLSLQTAFNTYFGLPILQPLPPQPWQYIPPAPQAQKEVEKEKQKPRYQATVEDDTETTAESVTKHGNSTPVSKSMLSTKARLCTTPACRDPAACPSNSLTSFLASILASFSASQLGYIRCMEGMEASGQG